MLPLAGTTCAAAKQREWLYPSSFVGKKIGALQIMNGRNLGAIILGETVESQTHEKTQKEIACSLHALWK